MLNWTDREERRIQSYVRLVLEGRITIDEVPEKYREEVRKRLENESEVQDV